MTVTWLHLVLVSSMVSSFASLPGAVLALVVVAVAAAKLVQMRRWQNNGARAMDIL